jgi:broad specificity phosphatase PhoE
MNQLKNHYLVMRHGQSKANVVGIILSSLEEGKKPEWTLTELGERQSTESALKAREAGILDAGTVIVSSPFSRALRTAEMVKEVLGQSADILLEEDLRERWFGELEGTSSENYKRVWSEDEQGILPSSYGAESAKDVQKRMYSVIERFENEREGQVILLVSHGDSIKILETMFRGVEPEFHRRLPDIENAEIWELTTRDK